MATSARRRKAEPDAEPEVAPDEQEPKAKGVMTILELNAEIKRLTAMRDSLIDGARQEFIDRVRSEAQGLGLSLDDLMPKAPVKGAKATKSGHASASVKYRDPETGATWSGRGRMAKRFHDLAAEGRSLEEFLVK